MKFVWKLAAAVVANGVGLYAATKLIVGFHVSTDPKDLFIAAAVLTGINFLIKPLLKLILSPIIILTLGVAVIGINALMIYVMTQLVPDIVSIDSLASPAGLLTLLYATILTSVINIIIRKIL